MSTSDSTGVYVAASRYPIRVLEQVARVGSSVARLDPLFRYEPRCDTESPESKRAKDKGKRREAQNSLSSNASTGYTGGNTEELLLSSREILTFESPVEGQVCQWCVAPGVILTDPNRPILRILEPCKHPVQLGGLCAVCGKDLTSLDYTGFDETSRANIQMTHDTSALTVSLEEAARLEHQTSERLLRQEKLSLIVDLDQTIIHATVDPTVGDWMEDASNPNNQFLRDVRKFRLLNEQGREDGCWYYVKPRPTLQKFLEGSSRLYEMHVYTMGTRAYAENVCRIIDPDGRIFGNRILSRDESGSMVHKSLTRLFPVDTSMVVIIDDRSDVWDWSPNLVKVIPYEFYVGIGDINGAFLPKQKPALPASVPVPSAASSTSAASAPSSPSSASSVSEAQTPASSMNEDTAAATLVQADQLDQQIHDRPLLKMQEERSAQLVKERKEHPTPSVTPSPAPSLASAPNTPKKAGDKPNDKPENAGHNGMSVDVPPIQAAIPDVQPPAKSAAPPVSPRPATVPLPAQPTNGIGASRFVSKVQQSDGVSSSSDEDSDDESGSSENGKEAKEDGAVAAKSQAVSESAAVSPEPASISEVKTPASAISEEKVDSVDTPKTETTTNEEDANEAEPEEQAEVQEALPVEEEEAVLRDDDRELDRVLRILTQVHTAFYRDKTGQRPEVPTIIPEMKSKVLRGCYIVFSSVIPLDQRPELADIWMNAELHGAVCQHQLSSRTTHLVAAKAGTKKVYSAKKRKSIHVVTPGWLLQSIAKWEREPEAEYPLDQTNVGEEGQVETAANSPAESFPSPSAGQSAEAGTSGSAMTEGTSPQYDDQRGEGEVDDGLTLVEEDEEMGLHDIDWGDAAAEVNALLAETDDEDDGLASADVSDAESTASAVAIAGSNRKRIRTPSASPGSRTKAAAAAQKEGTESPLSKRRKVAAARAGKSKLKLSDSFNAIATAGETASTSSGSVTTASREETPAKAGVQTDGEEGEGEIDADEEDDDDDDLNDFAKELEGELS